MLVLILILLRQWTNIPSWSVWIVSFLWIIKDVILFFFVWRAYEKNIPNSIIGSTGMAVDRLSPFGYVRINNELWRAKGIKGDSTIEKGETVLVTGLDGLTLTVISEEKDRTG